MYTYRQFIVTLILVVANFAYASDTSYDQQNITPQTWQEVDLSYTHKVNGKDYIEQVKLLRPTAWLEQYHLDKVGRLVELHESDAGINATVKVVALKPSKLIFNSHNLQNSHPVIGTFLKYSDDVWSYTFSNGETIEATSNHPFYDVDIKQYIPIGGFQLNGNHLLTDNGAKVQLSSKTKHNKGVEVVYNFEVYQAHNYKVGNNGFLVHNLCEPIPIGSQEAYRGRVNVNKYNISEQAFPYIHRKSGEANAIAFPHIRNDMTDLVIRVDNRSPQEIMRDGGFRALYIYMDHIYNNSISAAKVNLIDLLDNKKTALSNILKAAEPTEGEPIYVYQINAKGYRVISFDKMTKNEIRQIGAPTDAELTNEVQFLDPINVEDIHLIRRYSGPQNFKTFKTTFLHFKDWGPGS